MKLRLKQNEVVHCRTEKEANKVLKIADKCGKSWYDSTSYLKTNLWGMFEEETCYNINKGDYSSLNSYKEKNRDIITAKEFIKRHKKHKLKQDILSLQQAHNDLLERVNSFDKPSIKCQESKAQVLGVVNPKTKECWLFDKYNKTLRIKVNSLTSEKEERKSGWYKHLNLLYYIDFKEKKLFGFNILNTWRGKELFSDEWIKVCFKNYTKATDEEVLQRLTEEAKRRGFIHGSKFNCLDHKVYNNNCSSFKYDYFELMTDNSELWLCNLVIMKDGEWAEVVKPYEPKKGDAVKAWSEEESDNFVYGKLEQESTLYLVSGNWYKNIEKVTEININDFKN